MKKPFYGWFVLLGLFLVYMATNGILLNTLQLFYPELMKEFGWNEGQVTTPFSVFFVLTAALAPASGALADRVNPRWLMLAGVTIIVTTLGVYPFIESFSQLVLVYLGFAMGLSISGMVTSMIIITRWFSRLRGRAVGIFLMASSFGGAVFPLLARETLANEGWREAIWLLAVVGAVLTIIPLLILIRSHPHEKNLHADGADIDPPDVTHLTDRPSVMGAFKSLLRTPSFYLIAFVTATLWFCFVGVLQHQFIYFGRDLKIDSATLPIITSVFFWAAIIGKLLFGFLSDRYSITWIMLFAVINLIVGFAMLTCLGLDGGGANLFNASSGALGHASAWMLNGLLRVIDTVIPWTNVGTIPPLTDQLAQIFGYAIVFGIGYSGTFTMIQLLIAHRYAGPTYGGTLGVFTLVDTIGAAMGTQALGWLSVALGGYTGGFAIMIGLCVISAICVCYLIAQERRESPRAAPAPS